MSGRTNGPLPVDQLCRRLHDQIRAAVALDSVHQQAAMLCEVARFIENGEIELRATAWDGNGPAPAGIPMRAKFPGRCALCNGAIAVGADIYYDADSKRAAHAGCTEST